MILFTDTCRYEQHVTQPGSSDYYLYVTETAKYMGCY